MASGRIKTEILERFVAQCQRSTDLLLGFLKVDEDVYTGPSEPQAVVDALTAEFPVEDLLDSGLLVRGEQEGVALAPALRSGAAFIVLRDAVAGQPYELLTSDGCLAKDALPVFEMLRDSRTQQCLQGEIGDLIVACDLKEVILLRACGVPSTLAVGLDDLPPECLDRFCQSFGLIHSWGGHTSAPGAVPAGFGSFEGDHPEESVRSTSLHQSHDDQADDAPPATCDASGAAHDCGEPLQTKLAFLAWTPTELSGKVPVQLEAIVGHLRTLQRFLEVDIDEIGLWNVNEETLERLRFLVGRSDSARFRQALHTGACEIDSVIDGFGQEKPQAPKLPQNYTAALTRLHEFSSLPGGARRSDLSGENGAWRDVRRLLDRQIIAPLRDKALTTQDPLQRALLMGCSDLSEMFHLQSIVLSQQLTRRIAERGVERAGQLPKDPFKNLLATADRMIGLAKAAQQCPPKLQTVTEPRTIELTDFQRLPHSG